MEVIFLGTGTSQGVPMIAQPDLPGACDLDDARNWRTRTSVHVVMDGTHIQVDAGPEFRLQCVKNDIEALDIFILTHAHADHILGMDDMRRFCDLAGFGSLPVYSTEEGLTRVRSIFPYAIRDRPVVRGYPAFRLQPMPKRLECPGGTIESTLLPHGPMQVLGLVFSEKSTGKRFVYYTDCQSVPEEARTLARGADLVVLDALRPEPHPTHMNLEMAVEAAGELSAPQTYLTHLTFMVDHATIESGLPEGVGLAYDGLRVYL
mgnify:CR=1 FL=1